MIIEKIKTSIRKALPGSEVHVHDPMNDNTHFEAVVISKQFENISLVDQQRLVMKALRSEFDSNIVHALGLKTFTPERWMQVDHMTNERLH